MPLGLYCNIVNNKSKNRGAKFLKTDRFGARKLHEFPAGRERMERRATSEVFCRRRADLKDIRIVQSRRVCPWCSTSPSSGLLSGGRWCLQYASAAGATCGSLSVLTLPLLKPALLRSGYRTYFINMVALRNVHQG